jgi:tRNA-2-methylthio-N6-dimethylallyladenosine synthase
LLAARRSHRQISGRYISFPEIEKFDAPAAGQRDRRQLSLRLHHGRLQRSTVRSASCRTRAAEEVSRPFDDVIAEIARLAEQGVREVNLLGQNVNAYRGAMEDGDSADLARPSPRCPPSSASATPPRTRAN